MSSLNCFATASIFAFGPTRIGLISPSFAASTAPESELSSHGWATAVDDRLQRLRELEQAFVLFVAHGPDASVSAPGGLMLTWPGRASSPRMLATRRKRSS